LPSVIAQTSFVRAIAAISFAGSQTLACQMSRVSSFGTKADRRMAASSPGRVVPIVPFWVAGVAEAVDGAVTLGAVFVSTRAGCSAPAKAPRATTPALDSVVEVIAAAPVAGR
jgi:hypothetical protein